MLEKFRLRYPQGSLISELIDIHNGQYIVRTLVQIEGTTLATGLAAAETVEAAEDKARTRALSLMDLSTMVDRSKTSTKTKTTSASIPQPIKNETVAAPSYYPINNTPQEKETVKPAAVASMTSDRPTREYIQEPTPINSRLDAGLTATPEVPTSEPTLVSNSFASEEGASAKVEMSADLPPVIEMSDIIAQTDVEMKRLNWTKKQGQDYILHTYGKRSRQLLSDREIWEFLQYLKSQP